MSSIAAWERFSYYAMRGLLTLFLTASLGSGGFQWSEASTLRFMGVFTMLFYMAPALGGWISDHIFGRRKAIIWGGWLLSIGHLFMAGPTLLPDIISSASDIAVSPLIEQAGVELGRFGIPSIASNVQAAWTAAEHSTFKAAYWSVTLSFYIALLFIILGGSLLITSATALIGDHYKQSDSTRRDAGYTIYYLLIGVGALLSNLIAGTLGEKIGWHWGFTVAGLGMVLGLATYQLLESKWLDLHSGFDEPSKAPKGEAFKAFLWSGSFAMILAIAVFLITFWLIYEQVFGLLHLTIFNTVDRSIGGFEVPATWFQSLPPLYGLIVGPVIIAYWHWSEKKGRFLTTTLKLSLGFAFISAALLCLSGAFLDPDQASAARVSPWWFIIGFFFLTIGELIIAPGGFALVSKLAPAQLGAIIFGGWFLTDALGGLAGGYIGARAVTGDPITIFWVLGTVALACAAALIGLSKFERRLATLGEAANAEEP
ncbi:MAG: peptide MFS transporter [Pseudomonadota bacterium]